MMMLSVVIIATLVAVCHVEGADCLKLDVVQDVTIRHGSDNLDGHNVLLVGNNGGGITRTLLLFEDLDDRDCGTVELAELNMYYKKELADPARTLKVHKVKKVWIADEATDLVRRNGKDWNERHLGLDGSDAASTGFPTDGFSFESNTDEGFIKFDITGIVNSWHQGTSNNRGVLVRATNEKH